MNTQKSWEEKAIAFGGRVFPVKIIWDENPQKWDKQPLVCDWSNAASADPARIAAMPWVNANGFGIRTGDGIYALDIDKYKDGCGATLWLQQWQVPPKTRTHGTVSGGLHMIFRVEPPWENLRTRQNVVKGLDTRGHGGFIAFGEGYSLLDATAPVLLPPVVCAELDRPNRGKDIRLRPMAAVDAANVQRRLNLILTFGRSSLRRRWAGDPQGLHDNSCSGFDLSAAKLLAFAGFRYSEIYWLLITNFEHGVVGRDGLNKTTQRQIMRVAARATPYEGATSTLSRRVFG